MVMLVLLWVLVIGGLLTFCVSVELVRWAFDAPTTTALRSLALGVSAAALAFTIAMAWCLGRTL